MDPSSEGGSSNQGNNSGSNPGDGGPNPPQGDKGHIAPTTNRDNNRDWNDWETHDWKSRVTKGEGGYIENSQKEGILTSE